MGPGWQSLAVDGRPSRFVGPWSRRCLGLIGLKSRPSVHPGLVPRERPTNQDKPKITITDAVVGCSMQRDLSEQALLSMPPDQLAIGRTGQPTVVARELNVSVRRTHLEPRLLGDNDPVQLTNSWTRWIRRTVVSVGATAQS